MTSNRIQAKPSTSWTTTREDFERLKAILLEHTEDPSFDAEIDSTSLQ